MSETGDNVEEASTIGMDQMTQLLAKMAAILENQSQNQSRPESKNEMLIASLSAIEARIQEFGYSPEEGSTFERWWDRHADIFEIDLEGWDEVKKIRLLIRHVSTSVERTFTEAIAPKKWTEMTLKEVKEKMLTLFGDNTSTFDRRRVMLDLKMSKENIEDVRALAARVNQTVENAQVSGTTTDEWKVLIFLNSLDLARYSDVHLKMMQTAKQKGSACTLSDLLSVYNDVSQLKRDSRAITTPAAEVNHVSWQDRSSNKYERSCERDGSRVHKYSQEQNGKYDRSCERDRSRDANGHVKSNKKYEKSYTRSCDRCGKGDHTEQTCYRRRLKCFRCDRKGHVADECSEDEDEDKGRRRSQVDTVIVNSVKTTDYRIKVKLNGVTVDMDVDTGSDITFISKEVWRSIGAPDCLSSDCEAVCANGKQLEIVGKFMGELEYGEVRASAKVHVASTDRVIIGRDLIEKLRILKVRSDSEMEAKKASIQSEVEKTSAKRAESNVSTTNCEKPRIPNWRYDSIVVEKPTKDKEIIIQKEDTKKFVVGSDLKKTLVCKETVKEDVDVTQQ